MESLREEEAADSGPGEATINYGFVLWLLSQTRHFSSVLHLVFHPSPFSLHFLIEVTEEKTGDMPFSAQATCTKCLQTAYLC